ncbi:cob(I)yrinic acid a,c-diamide adenosyltransferase [Hydrotalea flava]|uniref:cob(I)yrinic acid a,c-diamide adenosyltransferase n=1 Tax=Hydrotalea flava TaxID=714549 RepID=UPI00082A3504|nr:cob(I)yrinic acid a,c-diamide adenosyltransferase [Hydrotalea flava]
MALKIYTKTGDAGNTSLIGGTKVAKNHIRIESYGTVDELNSFIGFLSDSIAPFPVLQPLCADLKEIQDRLFTIGSALACDPKKAPLMKIPDLNKGDVEWLEHHIDAMQADLPVMKHFILPGGHTAVSTAHITRCVCRRAERLCVAMQANNLFVDPLVIQYLNRLSDYLFVIARCIGHKLQIAEIAWKPRIQ